jgi:glycosyltransferase involved in cell wall biosynthesis
MKLLTIVDSYPPYHAGGYELRCQDILQGLSRRGHEILMITTRLSKKDGSAGLEGFPVMRVLYHRQTSRSIFAQIIRDYFDIRFIAKQLKLFKPDRVYLFHLVNLSNAIIPYLSTTKIPLIYDEGGAGLVHSIKIYQRGLYFYRNNHDSKFKKHLKKSFNYLIHLLSLGLLRTDWSWPRNLRFYFNSRYSMTYAQSAGLSLQRSQVIYSGIDIQKFPFREDFHPGKGVRIITPGRIAAKKGVKDAVALVSKLAEKNIQASLTVVGKPFETDYFDEIKQNIEDLNLGENIRVLPMIDHHELGRLYRDADICFFPSYQKIGLSRIPLEAMASRCVVITYGNEGSGEIIRDRKTGFVVPEQALDQVTDLIQTLLCNPTLGKEIAVAARKEIEQKYTLDCYIDRIEAFLLNSESQEQ